MIVIRSWWSAVRVVPIQLSVPDDNLLNVAAHRGKVGGAADWFRQVETYREIVPERGVDCRECNYSFAYCSETPLVVTLMFLALGHAFRGPT